MWSDALAGIRKHLLAYTLHSNLTILAERPSGLNAPLFPKMDHLVCFMPGTIALAATSGHTLAHARTIPSWTADHEAQIELARELTKTCWGMYKVTATGLSPEIAHFHVAQPAALVSEEVERRLSPSELSEDPEAEWRKDFDIHSNDVHNLQRPETVESLFYMWRITGEEKYREWGWEMFEAFERWTLLEEDEKVAEEEVPAGETNEEREARETRKADQRVKEMNENGGKKYRGFSSINDVNQIPPPTKDNMESFWLVSIAPLSHTTLPQSLMLTNKRPKLSNTSTSFSPSPRSSRSPTSCSTLKRIRSRRSSWGSCSRRDGRGRRGMRRGI